MALYTVLLPSDAPDIARAAERSAFVRDGFSWSAFLFGPFWLIVNRVWRWLLAWAAIFTLLLILVGAFGLSPEAMSWLSVLIAIYLGLEGNAMRSAAIERRGYHLVDIVSASKLEEAERSFFLRWLAGPQVAGRSARTAPALSPRGSEPVIGVFPEAGNLG